MVSGSVNAYQSDVNFYNCIFTDGKAIDDLSIIKSDYIIKDCLFNLSKGNALNLLYTKGEIINSSIMNIGGNGLILNGSILKGDKLFFKNLDKIGVESDKNCEITITTIEMDSVGIAFMCKNRSKLDIQELTKIIVKISFTHPLL